MTIGEKLEATLAARIPANAQEPDRGPAPGQPSWASAAIFALAVLAVAVRLFFWYYTRRTWEDALITVQHAENAARGLGLNHAPGGPLVHGFTSPISVLVPLLGEWMHAGFGMALLKVVSAICGGVTVWLAMRISQRLGLAFPITLLIGGYLAIEHQQILFGMAGMETQMAVTILLFSIYSLFDLKPVVVGISLGLCMLARPDFGFWVVLVIALVGWHCWKKRDVGPLETILLALLLIYGPWIAFTTWYYGSPLPNTILAKGWGWANRIYAGLPPSAFLQTLWDRTHYIFAILGPAYGGNGTGFSLFAFDPHGVISGIILLFVLVGIASAMRRRLLPALAIAGFVLVYSVYYVFLVPGVAAWYCVPLAAAAVLAAGMGVNATVNACLPKRWRSIAGYSIAAVYLASLAVIVPATFRGEREVQALVEEGVREKIGLYLASVMSTGQTVGCESLGYFGYYSRHVVFDYPGLANWQVTRFVHEHPTKRDLLDMLAYFRPDYLVLRPDEYETGLRMRSGWLTEYGDAIVFQVPEAERSRLLFPASSADLKFYVLKRKPGNGSATAH